MDFFRAGTSTAKKFHQASLLCLSLAFVFSSLVILNNQFYHWISYEKLTLDVFFLGFSFPVSLITFSVIFTFVKTETKAARLFEHLLFWTVNLGVIIFFIFIILELFVLEIAA